MILEKDKHMIDELKRLERLRKLVASEIQMPEYNNESDDMTIYDFEEWLQEIDAEILEMSKYKKCC